MFLRGPNAAPSITFSLLVSMLNSVTYTLGFESRNADR